MSTSAETSNTTGEKVVNHIAVIMAMEAEASHFIEQENLQLLDHSPAHGVAKIYQGRIRGCEVTLILPGKDADLSVDHVGTAPGKVVRLQELFRTESPNDRFDCSCHLRFHRCYSVQP